MTFKHVKFEDSATMRSLEKIAIEHGLISPENMTKTASAEKIDYVPSENLMENVIKLCSGLRELGFEKQANELESKFIDYKRAFSIYETSKEKGEDLIYTAHPKGSYTLKGVDGDAVIETILDEHIKLLKIVEKTPTGKLASTQSIIGAVKNIIAQNADVIKNSLLSLMGSLNLISYSYNKQDFLSSALSPSSPSKLMKRTEGYKNLGVISLEQAHQLKIDLNHLRKSYDPGTLGVTGVHRDVWEEMVPYFEHANAAINNIIKELSNPSKKIEPVKADPMDNFNKQLRGILSSIDQLTVSIENNPPAGATPDGIKKAIQWLENKKVKIINVKQKLDSATDKSPENIAFYSKLLIDLVNKPGDSLADFRKVWV